MIKHSLAVLAFSLGLIGASAYADCEEDDETKAGQIAAVVSKNVINKTVAVTGKQMVNIESCDLRAGVYYVEFKYNFLAADGLYWANITAKYGPGGANPSVKITGKSPNLTAAEAKSGIKLASN